jgi:hypothetical protein
MTDDTAPQDPKKPRKPAAKKAAPKVSGAAKKAAPAKKAPARKTAARKAPAKKAAPAKKTTPPAKKAPARKVASGNKLTKEQASEFVARTVSDMVGEAARSVGRPTKYRDEFVPQMIAFFNIRTQRVVETPLKNKDGSVATDKKGNVLTEKTVVTNEFPTLERFASELGVTRLTLHNWAHDTDDEGKPLRPEFLYAYARARDLQAALTIEGSYAGVYESRASTLGLKNLAGWKDQLETHVEGTITTATAEDLDAVYAKGIENSRRAAEEAKNRVLYGTVPGMAVLPAPGAVRSSDDDEDDDEHGGE